MTTTELEAVMDANFKKNSEALVLRVSEEGKAKGLNENEIKSIVASELKDFQKTEDLKKDVRAESMMVWEKMMATNESKGYVPPKEKDVVSHMIVSGLKAMEMEKATNIKNVGADSIIAAAKKCYPEEKGLHDLMTKTMTAGVPTAGGFGIPQIMIPGYIDYLWNGTILDKLGIPKYPMVNGNLSMPRLDSVSEASWEGELPDQDTSEPTFGNINLRAKKLFVKAIVSNSLLRQNTVGVDSIVSNNLRRASIKKLDQAFLYGLGSENVPRGLKYVTDIQTTGGIVNSTNALGLTMPIDMVALLEQANVPMDAAMWLFSPVGKSWLSGKAFSSGPFAWAEEIARSKTVNGIPFISSASVEKASDSAYSDFWLLDASLLMWGVSYDISLEMSREGSFVSGGQTINAFDKDVTLIRCISEHDFACQQPKAVVYGQFTKV
jgi:HK97 family phage major capsid protein